MRLAVQLFSATEPTDYSDIAAGAWGGLPSRSIAGVCVQGRAFTDWDFFHAKALSETLTRLWVWRPGRAEVWTFPTLAPDQKLGGAINTRQQRTVYLDSPPVVPRENTQYRRFGDFLPPTQNVLTGVAWSDDARKAHRAVRRRMSWREWTEGLAPSELDGNGWVKDQRAQGRYSVPRGTKTYYQRSTARAAGIIDAVDENALETTTGSSTSLTEEITDNNWDEYFAFTAPSNEPNVASWPSGTYRCQLDCSSVDDVEYMLRNSAGAIDGFLRISGDTNTIYSRKTQGEGAFSTTGLKMATFVDDGSDANWTDGSGSADDRFAVVVSAQETGGGTNELTLDVNTSDSFVDGPWSDAARLRRLLVGAGL